MQQLGSQTSRRHAPRWVLGNQSFWGKKVKGQGHEVQKKWRRELLRSCECWLFSSH